MAANRRLLNRFFGTRGTPKEAFITGLEQIDWDNADAIKDYLTLHNKKNKGLLLQKFGPQKISLLHWACSLNPHTGLEVVKFLIERGAGDVVNAQNTEGRTPLHIVANKYLFAVNRDAQEIDIKNLHDIIETLLRAGADPRIKNNEKFQPFSNSEFSWLARPELIQLLFSLSKSSRLNFDFAGESFGSTLIEKEEATNVLRDAFKIFKRSEDGLPGAFSKFKKKIHVSSSNENGHPLHSAAGNPNIKSLEIALSMPDIARLVNTYNKFGSTPLYVAAWEGHAEHLQLLLNTKVNPNIPNADGRAPLIPAVVNGHTACVKILLDAGAEVNTCYEGYATVLHLAAESGHLEVVQLLIKRGCDINTKADNGYIALHLAAQHNHLKIAQPLIERGSDVNAKAANGYTALHLAARRNHVEMVQLLIKRGGDVNAKADNGYTALHMAAHHSHVEMVQLLIERGGDVNAKADNGYTALHLAVQNGHVEIVRLLLERGANINAADEKGNTVLHHIFFPTNSLDSQAIIINEMDAENLQQLPGASELIALLFKKGAKITPNNDGHTPIDYARHHNATLHLEIFVRESRKAALEEIWTMETTRFNSFFQWLPMDTKDNVVQMSTEVNADNVNEELSSPRMMP